MAGPMRGGVQRHPRGPARCGAFGNSTWTARGRDRFPLFTKLKSSYGGAPQHAAPNPRAPALHLKAAAPAHDAKQLASKNFLHSCLV